MYNYYKAINKYSDWRAQFSLDVLDWEYEGFFCATCIDKSYALYQEAVFTVVLVAALVTPDELQSNLRNQPTIYILSSTK